MLFNSIEFICFLPIVFVLYWLVFKNLKAQNFFILLASCVFYGWWSPRFLILIAITAFCSWGSGLLIQKNGARLKPAFWLWSNIILNVGILAYFKYSNFFVENFIDAFRLLGISLHRTTLNVILPVGVSFYTFQALSYSIDVYKRKISATKNFISFCAFLTFFPQLVAGPIERATNLLPQFERERHFDYQTAVDGCRQILWGFFKKVVIADSCAVYVDAVFGSYQTQTGVTLLFAIILFAFQIYGDFSGYSDIAIGCGKLFGIKLMRNFNNPYFSRNIAEFWRRWHISLTTWFRDYIYIPLGGSRCSKIKVIRNTFIIFLVCGFWHGANWTFIAWGAYHAVLFLPLILLSQNRKYLANVAGDGLLPSLKESMQMLFTFALVVLGWIFFRADSVGMAVNYIASIGTNGMAGLPASVAGAGVKSLVPFIVVMLIVEWLNRNRAHGLDLPTNGFFRFRTLRILSYWLLILAVWGNIGGKQVFIYFQF